MEERIYMIMADDAVVEKYEHFDNIPDDVVIECAERDGLVWSSIDSFIESYNIGYVYSENTYIRKIKVETNA